MAVEISEQENRAVLEGEEATVVQRPHGIRRSSELGDQRGELVPNGRAIGLGLHGEAEGEMTLHGLVTLGPDLVDRHFGTVGHVL